MYVHHLADTETGMSILELHAVDLNGQYLSSFGVSSTLWIQSVVVPQKLAKAMLDANRGVAPPLWGHFGRQMMYAQELWFLTMQTLVPDFPYHGTINPIMATKLHLFMDSSTARKVKKHAFRVWHEICESSEFPALRDLGIGFHMDLNYHADMRKMVVTFSRSRPVINKIFVL